VPLGRGRGVAPPPGRGVAPPPAPPPAIKPAPPASGGRGGPPPPGGRGGPGGDTGGHPPPAGRGGPPPPGVSGFQPGPSLPGTGSGHAHVLPQVAALPTGPPEKPLPESAPQAEAVYPGVGHYSGAVKAKERQGRGVFTFGNGDVYRGEWSAGRMHGYGEYSWKGGCRYAGDWTDGKHEGRGFLSWGENQEGTSAKVDRYTGSFKNGFRDGLGSESWTGRGVYAGEWQADKRAGRGTFKWDNGNIYDGEWAADQRSGMGLFLFANGRRFEGRFEKDCPREGLRSESDGTALAVKYDPQGVIEIEREPHPMDSLAVNQRDYTGPRYSATRERISPERLITGDRVTLANAGLTHAIDPGAGLRAGVLNARVRQIEVTSGNALDEYDKQRQAGMQGAKSPAPTMIGNDLAQSSNRAVGSHQVASSTYIPLSALVSSGDATVNHVPLRHVVQTPLDEYDKKRQVTGTPPTPSVRAVGRPVEMRLKLALDFDTAVGGEGSDSRSNFEKDLCQDLASATGLPSSSFALKKLSPGSVIVDLEIRPNIAENCPDPFAAAGDLAEQASDPGVCVSRCCFSLHASLPHTVRLPSAALSIGFN
jgi:hypothetical protein